MGREVDSSSPLPTCGGGGQGERVKTAVLAEYLEYLRDSGVHERWGARSFMWDKGEDANNKIVIPAEAGIQSFPETPTKDAAQGELPFKDLPSLREYIGECARCKLHKGRTHLVFGVGNPDARLVFVGEGPGRDEDLQGEPFVGRAGQLLTDIIEKGMKLKRSDVYIANVVKCRPPENRNPENDEIAACEGFLMAQLDIIKPRLICALGKFAAQTLLKTTTPISALRGNIYEYHGIKLMPTYHPAYLLRNPKEKAVVWQDIQKLMVLYDE